MNTRAMLLCGCGLMASAMQAQVGRTPERSPFRDVEKRQEVTLLVGPSLGGKDRAGAAPRGGQAFGARYDYQLGASPVAFTGAVMLQTASRDVLQPGNTRRIGRTVSQPLIFTDVGFTMLLTGNKSWHSIMPSITAGGGLVFDGRAISDSSQFQFGTRFGILFGAGVKYAPERSRWTVRADLTNRLYNVKYPGTFSDSTANVPRIVPPNVSSDWTRNTMITLGIVRGFGRR
jgi:hypothetical protein